MLSAINTYTQELTHIGVWNENEGILPRGFVGLGTWQTSSIHGVKDCPKASAIRSIDFSATNGSLSAKSVRQITRKAFRNTAMSRCKNSHIPYFIPWILAGVRKIHLRPREGQDSLILKSVYGGEHRVFASHSHLIRMTASLH